MAKLDLAINEPAQKALELMMGMFHAVNHPKSDSKNGG
jgi:hypothetical protein